MNHQSHPPAPEIVRLQYPDGWHEILTAADTADYQHWLLSLTQLSQRALQECAETPLWSTNADAVMSRWQRAIEVVGGAAMDGAAIGLSEDEIIETALITTRENIAHSGWLIPGISFAVPFLSADGTALIDIRGMLSAPLTAR